MVNDDQVEVAVAVEIAAGQPASHVERLEIRACTGGDVGKAAVSLILPDDRWILVGIDLSRLTADMAIGHHQVEITVEVQIGQYRTPTGQWSAVDCQARFAGLILVKDAIQTVRRRLSRVYGARQRSERS